MGNPIPVTDCKNLSYIRTQIPQNRRLACSNLRPVIGLDTETYNGTPFLIADSDARTLDDITTESVIRFLFAKKYQNTWNFFYNISYDAEVILKLLGEDLNSYKTTGSLTFPYDDYTLDYIPGKKLAIRKGHHSVIFFDIAQFYHTTLVDAYLQNIGPLPEHYLSMKKKRKQFSLRFYRRNKQKVVNYCVFDCQNTKKLAQNWIGLFYKAFSFYSARWLSSGYLAEKVLINNGVIIPKFDSTPYEIQRFAYQCYFGGRFEILKRGFIGTAFLYDINSAYPFALSQIPDITKGQWIQSNKIQNDAEIGFFKILVDVPDCKFVPPFPFRANRILVFPSGKFITFCTLDELLACQNVQYKILDSHQFIPDHLEFPYIDFIVKMYKKRQELKQDGNPLELPIKIILNSIYGKTGAVVKSRIGSLFNPVLFATITGKTRAQLYEFVCKNNLEKSIVSFATDSICTTKELNLNSDKLGELSFEKSANDVFYLQNGLYRFDGQWKQRGLGKLGRKQIEELKVYEKDGKLFTKFKILRPSRLRQSILENRISDIGKFKKVEREVNLNADRKRFWLGQIKSIDDRIMNESVPLSLNYFNKNCL